jgi:hypothetical protein
MCTFCNYCPLEAKLTIPETEHTFSSDKVGCETLSLTLSEEHELRASENRVLQRIQGLKRQKAIAGRRKLHNEELHKLYTWSSNHGGWYGTDIQHAWRDKKNTQNFSRITEGKEPLGRARRTWQDTIKMVLKKQSVDADWAHLGGDRDHCRAFVNMSMNLRIP